MSSRQNRKIDRRQMDNSDYSGPDDRYETILRIHWGCRRSLISRSKTDISVAPMCLASIRPSRTRRTKSVVPVRLRIAGSQESHLAHTLDVQAQRTTTNSTAPVISTIFTINGHFSTNTFCM